MSNLLDAVAREIIGENRKTPEWLDSALLRQVEHISIFRNLEAKAPQRTLITRKLDAFQAAIATLKEGINDPVFMAFLGHNYAIDGVSEVQIDAAIDNLSRMVRSARTKASKKPTVPLAFPLDSERAITAQILCAHSVRHLIRFARATQNTEGKVALPQFVGPDNTEAHSIANALWKASGGAPLGSLDGNRPATGWRHHFIAAKAAEEAGDERSSWLAIEVDMMRCQPLPVA